MTDRSAKTVAERRATIGCPASADEPPPDLVPACRRYETTECPEDNAQPPRVSSCGGPRRHASAYRVCPNQAFWRGHVAHPQLRCYGFFSRGGIFDETPQEWMLRAFLTLAPACCPRIVPSPPGREPCRSDASFAAVLLRAVAPTRAVLLRAGAPPRTLRPRAVTPAPASAALPRRRAHRL
jgi:hypothetical protein